MNFVYLEQDLVLAAAWSYVALHQCADVVAVRLRQNPFVFRLVIFSVVSQSHQQFERMTQHVRRQTNASRFRNW